MPGSLENRNTKPGLTPGLFCYHLLSIDHLSYNFGQVIEVSLTKKQSEPTDQAGQGQGQTDTFQFVANLTDRQHSLMLNGKGDRTLIELEAFGVWALMSLVGLAKFTGRQFLVTIQELPGSMTELHDAPKQEPEKAVIRVGRRGPQD